MAGLADRFGWKMVQPFTIDRHGSHDRHAMDLHGKVAIVTGCDTGLGQGMAVALAQAGADVVGVNVVAPTDTHQRIEALGRGFLDLRANLADIGCIEGLLAQARDFRGHVDILVNNAGIIRREDAIKFTEKDWDDVINVNQRTLFVLGQAAARQMVAQKRGGKIINIASVLSYQGGVHVPAYTAAKHGVVGLARHGALRWAKNGIRVNAVCPGPTLTPMITRNLGAERIAAVARTVPMGRWVQASDIANAIEFLATDASAMCTGIALDVDGGVLVSNGSAYADYFAARQ